MVYGESKDLAKWTKSDKVLRNKAFKIASDPKQNGYQTGLASMAYKFFYKKSSGSGVDAEPNYQLASELHRQTIRKFKRWKVYSLFRDNFWGCWFSWCAITGQIQQRNQVFIVHNWFVY